MPSRKVVKTKTNKFLFHIKSHVTTTPLLQRSRRIALEQDRAGRAVDRRAAFGLQRDLEQLVRDGVGQVAEVELQRLRLTRRAE